MLNFIDDLLHKYAGWRMKRYELRTAKEQNKVSGKFMNRVVVCLILAALVFTVIIMIVFIKTGQEPSTLIDNFFRFLSVEGGALALIKSVKVVKTKKENTEPHDTEFESINEEG